jgi:hypothetical protein
MILRHLRHQNFHHHLKNHLLLSIHCHRRKIRRRLKNLRHPNHVLSRRWRATTKVKTSQNFERKR